MMRAALELMVPVAGLLVLPTAVCWLSFLLGFPLCIIHF